MNPIKKHYWQLPWAGPRIDGDRCGWAVMPDPALGNAMGVCLPVIVVGGRVVLQLADPGAPIPISEVLLGVWTTLAPLPGRGEVQHLCLLGYDQPEGGFGREYFVEGATTVPQANLQAAVSELQRVGEKEVLDHLVHWPAYDCRTNQPSAPAEPGVAVSMAMVFGSCQYPSGLMDAGPAEASYRRLADHITTSEAGRPTHLLLVGDQVYVDATAGLLDPIRLDDRFRVPYEQLVRIESLRRVMRRVPVFCMLDDHEINDNWEPFRQGAGGSLYQRGIAAYWTFQRMRLPASVGPMPPIWYSVGGVGWSAFMINTRTARDWRSEATLGQAQILGEVQQAALEQWLLGLPADHLKLVAGPAMLLPRLLEHMDDPLHLDNWQGYPRSLHRTLAFLFERQIANVHFLSGDAHLGCDVKITITGRGAPAVTTRSTHAPALYAPLPFANEQPWNLKLQRDSFRFPDAAAGPYTCELEGGLLQPSGDGWCLLKADRAGSNWTVTTQAC
jgi:hypothetical protein